MLNIKRCIDFDEMSLTMINDFVAYAKKLLNKKDLINIAIATGITTEQFILLLKQSDIPFEKINLYIVDEYAGIAHSDQQSCTIDLLKHFGTLTKRFHSIKIFSTNNFVEEIDIYHQELIKYGLDICILGVGKDGHVGFCYPPAYINTKKFYELIELSSYRKKEHSLNGWFSSIDNVPDCVITLSLWGILQSSIIMVGAVYKDKEDVVMHMLKQDVSSSACPILYFTSHKNITLYLG